jgi:17beta-estradiol 17-dehydrogenase / very-long-chain 3-oxoacyl-CoA reductase
VINLSSYTADLPTPLLGVYAGSKAFIGAWSTALKGEYKQHGIDVVTVGPFYVKSDMTQFRKTSLVVCGPEVIAKSKW